MATKVLVILADGFEEIEAIAPIDLLRRAGLDVTTAGLEKNQATSTRGVTVLADKLLTETDTGFDAVVLPGGLQGSKNIAASPVARAVLQTMHAQNKIIAAICAAPAIVLSPLGILKNKAATCFPGMEKHFGPDVRFKEDPVVVDGHLITSRAAGTALAFSLVLVEKLAGAPAKEKVIAATLANP